MLGELRGGEGKKYVTGNGGGEFMKLGCLGGC